MVSGFSDLDGEVSTTTTLPAPTLDGVSVTDDDITATYTLNDNSTDGDVLLELSTDGGSTWSDGATTSDLNATSLTAVDESDTTTYTVRITRRTDDATASSGTLSATTEDFTFTNITSQEVSFAWRNPDSINQDDYRIEREQVGVTGYENVATVSGTTESYTDTTVIPGEEYNYRIIAIESGTETEIASGNVTVPGGGGRPRIGSSGWSVSVTHPTSGRVIRPDVINPNSVQYLPGPNMMPRIRLPVRRAPSWLESEFDDNPNMDVYLDGEELPVGELVDVEQEEGQTILIGEGGAELRTVVDVEYDAERRPVAATDLVDSNTSYTTVDNSPAPTSESNVVQNPSGESDLGNFITVSNDPPLQFTSGGLKPHQTAWTVEGENSTDANAGVNETDGSYSSGEAEVMGDDGEYVEYDFTPAYTIPSGEFEAWWRGDVQDSNVPDARWQLLDSSDTVLAESDTQSYGITGLEWRRVNDTFGNFNPPELSGGSTYTLRFEENDSSPPTPDYIVDVVCPVDSLTRVTGGADAQGAYTFDNSVHTTDGYLEGPELYPTLDAVFDSYESAFSIVGGSVSVTINDTTNDQALALSNDRGASYDITGSNTTSISGSFPDPGATLNLKVTLSRYEPSGLRSQTPRAGYDAQRLDAYELTGTIEFESLLINDDFGDSINTVLSDILGSRYAWTYSIESGTPTITVDEPGNSVASRDPEISESQITKKVITYDTVRIKGSSLSISGETFQASTSFQNLNEDDIVPGSEAVYDDTGTNYQQDIDYTVNYSPGEIKALDGGDLDTTSSYSIDYRHQVESSHTVPSATGDTLVRTIPGVTSDRQAEQIAYVLAEVYPAVSTPRYEGEIVVPRLDATFDPLEGLNLDDMDLPDVARPLSIRGEPELTPLGLTLRLGSAPSLEESLRAISEQVSAVSDRV